MPVFPHLSDLRNFASACAKGAREGAQRQVEEMLDLVPAERVRASASPSLSGASSTVAPPPRPRQQPARLLCVVTSARALDLKLRKESQLLHQAVHHDHSASLIHVTATQEEAMTMADRIA